MPIFHTLDVIIHTMKNEHKLLCVCITRKFPLLKPAIYTIFSNTLYVQERQSCLTMLNFVIFVCNLFVILPPHTNGFLNFLQTANAARENVFFVCV